MKNTASATLLLLSLSVLSGRSATDDATPSFRADAPSERSAVTFRNSAELAAPSAVAVSSAGVSDSGFVPTLDSGSAITQRRPYHFTLSLSEGYDDNIYTSHFDKQGSLFTSASVGVSLQLSDGRTSLRADLIVGGSYYYDRKDSFDPNISLNLDFSHVFSPKLRLDIATNLAYQAEPEFQSGFGQNRRSGNYFLGSVDFRLSQTLSRRFSLVYGYRISGVSYDESTVADISNRIEQNLSLQLRYLIQPTVTLVGEYRFGIVTYDAANRDSTSNYILGGLDFTLNRRLTASFRAGAQFRDSDDLGQETSPFVESTLSYQYAGHSTLQWVNRYGFEESEFGFGSTRKTYRTGISINHAFTARITGNLGAYYTTSDYSGSFAPSEETIDANISLSYAINRLVSLQTGYTYTKVYSDNIFREYDRNRVFAGVTFSF